MDPITDTDFGTIQPPPVVSGQELYDSIMKDIEPELLTANLPMLNEKYANETDGEHTVRMQRYDNAFAEYDKRFAQQSIKWDNDYRAYKRAAISQMESDDRSEEANALTSIESSLAA